MKLTVDTSADSKEDIKRAIEFLTGFLEERKEPDESQPGMMQMFDKPKEEPEKKPEAGKVQTYDI